MRREEETSKVATNTSIDATQSHRIDDALMTDAIEVVVERGWISDETASRLLFEAKGDSATALKNALEQGLLSAKEYDIAVSLSGLRQVAPGYRVTGLIGQGGMGAVFRAIQETLDRPVALKTILVDSDSQAEAMARFAQEAKAVAKLRHPNVITAYDYGSHSGRMYLAMELVEGEDLDSRLESGVLDEFVAWHIARQVAAALSAAAKEGIVHRDIKPANILLVAAPDGANLPNGVPMVKVADFGLSFLQEGPASERVTSANVAVGSPNYMAPELLSGLDATPATDIYSLGATLFRCLSGEPPFANQSLPAIVSSKVAGIVPEVKTATPETRSLLEEMMAADPNDRPSDFHALIDRIDSIVGGPTCTDSGTLRSTSAQPRQAQSSSNSWAKVAGALAMVVLTALIVTAIAPKRPAPKELAPEQPGRPVLTIEKMETGLPIALFNSTDIDRWRLIGGAWTVGEGSDGGPALMGKATGSAGVIERSVAPILYSRDQEGNPISHFRVEAVVESDPGQPIGFRFNFNNPDDGSFYELLLSDGEAQIARHDGTAAAPSVVESLELDTHSVESESGETIERSFVQIDFCATKWTVAVNEQRLKPIEVLQTAMLEPKFELAVPSGEARFSDITFVELIPVSDQDSDEAASSTPADASSGEKS